jgi:hypothetical protein
MGPRTGEQTWAAAGKAGGTVVVSRAKAVAVAKVAKLQSKVERIVLNIPNPAAFYPLKLALKHN